MDATSTSIHSGFSTSLPIKYSFAFSKIYRNIPPVYFVSLFVVRLKNNINISFLFFHFFQNILEKYFSKLRTKFSMKIISAEKNIEIVSVTSQSRKVNSLFILSRRKESRFKSIFSG